MPITWVTTMGQAGLGSCQGTAPTASSSWTWAGTNAPITSTAPTFLTSQIYQAQALANQTVPTGLWASAITNPCYYTEQDVNHQQYMALAQQRVVAYYERTAEEVAQQQAQAQEQARRQAEYSRQHQEALAKSRELLLEHLTPEQRKTFQDKKWFLVEGGVSKTVYRINTDR